MGSEDKRKQLVGQTVNNNTSQIQHPQLGKKKRKKRRIGSEYKIKALTQTSFQKKEKNS